MKNNWLPSLGIILISFLSCNYFPSKHPQATLPGEGVSTAMTDNSILSFAAEIDKTLPDFKKESSLIYITGDLTLYTEKYSGNTEGMLYKTFSTNGNTSSSVKSYYFKNDSLILVKEQNRVTRNGGEVFKDLRAYLRNQVPFKMDTRTASSATAIAALPYLAVQPSEFKFPLDDYPAEIKNMRDAIAGTDKFEMVFDNIATYPDAKYIFLKSKLPVNYKSSIMVNIKDAFVDSLLSFPAVFKDQKLNVHWEIKDNEAIYVPVESTQTSASGLNK